jgi:glycosyltransferase involved in cell wall biosynthesis
VVCPQSELTSIIPVYLDNGMPLKYFKNSLDSICNQKYSPIEIIVTDDTSDISKYPEFNEILLKSSIPIRYLKNRTIKGMAGNSNNALKEVKTKYVHILHSDDQIVNAEFYLDAIDELKKNNAKWLFAGGTVANNSSVPFYSEFLIFGLNSLGGPSGMIAETSSYVRYDLNLRMLVDVYQYQKVFSKFGPPVIMREISIEYGVGKWQVQNNIKLNEYVNELIYVIENSNYANEKVLAFLNSPGNYSLKIRFISALYATKRINYFTLISHISYYKLQNLRKRLIMKIVTSTFPSKF